LTISILGLVLVAMSPFIRTVHSAWKLGDRRTEIQQNGRVAQEMLSRLIRQAKRITGIPSSGSGNFIKFRDALDTQTIIFYHNIPASVYYIGNVGLIKEKDLVMRTIDIGASVTDALLARSLPSFQIDFKDDAGGRITQPYQVTSLDIALSLSDSQGLIPDVVNIFSSLSLRPQVRINKAVWVAIAKNIAELSGDNWIDGFLNPKSVSVNSADGSCWVADTGNNLVKKLAADGRILLKLSGFSSPASVSVNFRTGDCWVADTGNSQVVKLDASGREIFRSKKNDFKTPQSVSANSTTGDCWVADTGNNRVRKILASGTILNYTGFRTPQSVSANSTTGDCWVADTGNNRVRKILASGTILNYTGFKSPQAVSTNSVTGDCWVADTGNNQVAKLDPDGNEEFRISGFISPLSLASLP
jgi:hypothetical protein